MGRLIPAGTGPARYQNIGVQIEGFAAATEVSGGLVETSSGDAWEAPPDTTATDFGT
jgi:hypothetical protein